MSRPRRPIRATVRRAVWERDEGRCWLCGNPVDTENVNLDHLIPVWFYEANLALYEDALDMDGEDNLAVSHPACNRRRITNLPGRRTVDPEFHAEMRRAGDLADDHHAVRMTRNLRLLSTLLFERRAAASR